MSVLPRFAYHDAKTFEEAFELRARYGDGARYFSGGTALALLMRAGFLSPKALIGVRNIPGMQGIKKERGIFHIGAATPHVDVADHPEIRASLPTLAKTFYHVATTRVRNVATAGGNLAHANPHQDPPVTFTALGATVVARSSRGERRIPIDQFFVDYFQTSLTPDEILSAIEVPVDAEQGCGCAYIKYLPRSQDDYSVVNVTVRLRRAGGRIKEVMVAVGSMAPTVIRATEAEQVLIGREPDEARLREASGAWIGRASPELDSRGSPEYKMRVAPVIVRRAIESAWRSAVGGAA